MGEQAPLGTLPTLPVKCPKSPIHQFIWGKKIYVELSLLPTK